MKVYRTDRGFPIIDHATYAPQPGEPVEGRLIQASSAIREEYEEYADAFDRPGTSYLWVGERHHLNREEVRELIGHLQSWLDRGTFVEAADKPRQPAPAGQGPRPRLTNGGGR